MKTKGRVLLLILVLSLVFIIVLWKEFSNSLKNNNFSIPSSYVHLQNNKEKAKKQIKKQQKNTT